MKNVNKLMFIAGIFNFSVVISMCFLPELVAKILQFENPVEQNLWFYFSMGLVAVFGGVYFTASIDVVRFKEFILLGAIAKSVVVLTIFLHGFVDTDSFKLLLVGAWDGLFAILFYRLYKTITV